MSVKLVPRAAGSFAVLSYAASMMLIATLAGRVGNAPFPGTNLTKLRDDPAVNWDLVLGIFIGMAGILAFGIGTVLLFWVGSHA